MKLSVLDDSLQICFKQSVVIIKTVDQLVQYTSSLNTNANALKQVLSFIENESDSLYDELKSIARSEDNKILIHYLKTGKLNYCAFCGKPTLNSRYCSKSCADSDPNKHKKQQETNLKKYGCRFNAQRPDVIAKRSHTLLERYGDSKYVNIGARTKTIQEKYGVNNVTESQMFQEKSKQTCLEKYGKERYQNTDEFIQKRSNTWKERYSSAEAIQTINDKRRNTITQRYGGYDNLGRKKYDHEVAEYRKQFGDFVCDLILSKQKQKDDVVYIDRVKQHFNEEYIRKHFIVDKKFNFIELQSYFHISSSYAYRVKDYFNIKEPNKNEICKSQFRFLQQFDGVEVLINRRDIIAPYELDGYFPHFHLAVEMNGILYHSIGPSKYSRFTRFNDSNYHRSKYKMCYDKGITLFSMFDSDEQSYWVNLIRDALGYNKPSSGHVKVVDVLYAQKFIHTYSIFNNNDSEGCECLGLVNEDDHIIQVLVYKDNQIVNVATEYGYSNNYHILFKEYCRTRDSITFRNNDQVGDYMVRNMTSEYKYKIIGTEPPTCRYFSEYRQNKQTGTVVTNFVDKPLTLDYRALYNCGYTTYQWEIGNE